MSTVARRSGVSEDDVREAAEAIFASAKFYTTDRYEVTVRPADEPGWTHLAIRRTDGQRDIPWRDRQRIKNELVGPECEGGRDISCRKPLGRYDEHVSSLGQRRSEISPRSRLSRRATGASVIARRDRLQGKMLADRLAAILPASDRPVFKAALAGEAEAALATMATLAPSGHAAYVPLALYLTGAPLDALRAAAMQGWVYHHRPMIQAAGPRLLPMLRAAKFPDITAMPERVEVWRGTCGISLREARAGLAWTNSRRVAAFYALQHWPQQGLKLEPPLVVRRVVRRRNIVLARIADASGIEPAAELVIDAPPAGEIDGDRSEWTAELLDALAPPLAARPAGRTSTPAETAEGCHASPHDNRAADQAPTPAEDLWRDGARIPRGGFAYRGKLFGSGV
jgi:hypothetical protein